MVRNRPVVGRENAGAGCGTGAIGSRVRVGDLSAVAASLAAISGQRSMPWHECA